MGMNFELLGEVFSINENYPFVDSDFYDASQRFFDKANDDPAIHDNYFSRLAAFINQFMRVGLWFQSEQMWNKVVQPALDWEAQHPGRFIHKGTLYYFWGMASISRGELDMGYPLMHQALQEDIRTQQKSMPPLPAYWFATLDYQKLGAAFRDWTQAQSDFLNNFLSTYNGTFGRNLRLDDFRTRFLDNNTDLDLVFLFAYALGRLMLFDRVPSFAQENKFTSQLDINILFDLILVIDAAIKIKNPGQRYFSSHAFFLSTQAGLGVSDQQIRNDTNTAFTNNFDHTLLDILDGNFQFADTSKPSKLASDLLISYGLRNFGAHHISSVPTVGKRFQEIRQSLFNTLFLTVETLY